LLGLGDSDMLPLVPMYLRYLYYALWIAPVPVFVCLAAVMVRRKLHKTLPFFFTLAVFQLADFGIKFYCYHRSEQEYFYAYWTLSALEILIGFGVIYEVFTSVFRPFDGLRELGAVLFRWAALVLVFFAVLMASNGLPVAGQRITATIVNLDRSIQVMQCGLVLLMILCSSYLGLTWKHRIFGIAAGMGINAAVELIAVTVLANLGQEMANTVRLAKMATYSLSALLWMGYIYAGEEERQPAQQLARARGWDYALAALHPSGDGPALPLIEDVVERVWKEANGKSKPGAQPPHQAEQ
jgi:hypothetical protein